MIKSEKKVRELNALLTNENSLLISEGIAFLREEEPFEGAIGILASFYDNSDDNSVRKTIEGFLNDLKDKSVRKEIMDEIRKPFRQSTINMLLASCWQSGLDYSGYSLDLLDIFLKSDYVTALECMTILEESVHELSKPRRIEMINIIKGYPQDQSDQKTGLAGELLSILGEEHA